MLEDILEIDQAIFLWLNAQHSQWLDPFMFFISETFVWIPFYAFLIGMMYFSQKKRLWITLLGVAFTLIAADKFTSDFMKPYFERPRPTHAQDIAEQVHTVNNYRGGSYGFASSHAANTFGLAMLLWCLFRRRWRIPSALFMWAAMVSYSRIYLGVHYPLDILFGALVGILFAYIFAQLCIRLEKKVYSAPFTYYSKPG